MIRPAVLASLLLCAACAKTSVRDSANLPAGILNELTNAEHMIQSQLRGNPKIMDQELKLLHGAETAVRHNKEVEELHPKGAQLLQQATTQALKKDENLLGMAKTEVDQLLKGHPAELRKEEQALDQAMSAARYLSKPAPAFVETKVSKSASISEMVSSSAMLEDQRSSSMATALQEKRNYASAEDKLATEGSQILSKFATLKDAIAQAFAGKDSNAVKTAMEAGEMVDAARTKQQEVTKLNRAEASKAEHEAAVDQAAFAQMSAQSKAMQEQRAYTSGMARLVSDGKTIAGELSDLKSAVANAYAGKNSKAVEDAMEVGELLDQARRNQQDVTHKDEKEAADARDLFHKLQARHHHTTLIQKQGAGLSTANRASHAMRLQRLRVDERHTLQKTKDAENAVKHLLASSHAAGAATVQHEVVDALEKAEQAEETALASTSRAHA